MEKYRKGRNEEEPLDRQNIPIPDLPENFLWMQVNVRGGSKIRNLLQYALNNTSNTVVWTGVGPSVGKAITCAEIMKREYDNKLHQITKICYKNVDEYWDPILPKLDQLVVKRKLPMIHICLSSKKLNENELGYQAPGEIIPYKGQNTSQAQKKPPNRNYSKRSRDHRNNTSGIKNEGSANI